MEGCKGDLTTIHASSIGSGGRMVGVLAGLKPPTSCPTQCTYRHRSVSSVYLPLKTIRAAPPPHIVDGDTLPYDPFELLYSL